MRPATAELQTLILHTLHDVQLDCAALVAAFDASLAGADPLQQLVAASGLMTCLLVREETYPSFSAAAQTVFAHLDRRAPLDDPMLAYLAAAGDFGARYHRQRGDPALPALGEALVRGAADGRLDASLRCAGAIMACSVFDELVDVERIRWAELALRDVRADPTLNPRLAGSWDFTLVRAYHVARQLEHARTLRRRLSAATPRIELDLALLDARTLLAEGQLDAARQALARAEPLLGPPVLQQAAIWHFLRSRLALIDGRAGDALVDARLAVRLIREVGCPISWAGPLVMQEGQVLIALGRPLEAVPFFEEAGRADSGVQADYCWCLAHLARALGAGADEPALRRELGAGLALARRLDWIAFLRPNPQAVAQLCERALERDIEAGFVRRVVAERGLQPQQPAPAVWPWPIRLRLLGRFEIEIDGRPLVLRGKGAKKPLELLQFVIAAGGSDVASASVVFALWPELEGDHARSAFNVALHRLRKLLGHDSALVLEHGKLGLDSSRVWVDCLAFEALADRLTGPLDAAQAGSAERALALYAGPWRRDDDDDAAWQKVCRMRLASKWKRLVRALAAYRIEHGERGAARDLLERAIELEPQAEDLVRELMQLLEAQGEAAAALAAFEHCRETLAATLGVAPAPATLALQTRLREAGAAAPALPPAGAR